MIQEAHVRNLLIMTYGADKYVMWCLKKYNSISNNPDNVDIQKRNGIDAIISDKVTKVRLSSFEV